MCVLHTGTAAAELANGVKPTVRCFADVGQDGWTQDIQTEPERREWQAGCVASWRC
jgi:hypothetical protein